MRTILMFTAVSASSSKDLLLNITCKDYMSLTAMLVKQVYRTLMFIQIQSMAVRSSTTSPKSFNIITQIKYGTKNGKTSIINFKKSTCISKTRILWLINL